MGHVVQLEQWLMEGAYNKVLAARQQLPAPSYAAFMDLLATTVRYVNNFRASRVSGGGSNRFSFQSLPHYRKCSRSSIGQNLSVYTFFVFLVSFSTRLLRRSCSCARC